LVLQINILNKARGVNNLKGELAHFSHVSLKEGDTV
jgi:hypothetical protein